VKVRRGGGDGGHEGDLEETADPDVLLELGIW
jgi:hypothetical protein